MNKAQVSLGKKLASLSQCQLETLWYPFRVIARLVRVTGLPVSAVLDLRREAYADGSFVIAGKSWSATNVLPAAELEEWVQRHRLLLLNEYLFEGGLTRSALYNSFVSAIENLPVPKDAPLRGAHPVAVIAGFPKCATTWFYETCKAFDFIDVGLKENCYFSSSNHCRGDVWYQNLFSSEKPVRIDVSQDYLIAPGALTRLADYQERHAHRFKILVFLRAPSAWIRSAILQHRQGARIWDDLGKYLKTGYAAWNYERTTHWWDSIGKLAGQFSEEEILLVFHEDIARSPKETFLRVIEFLQPGQRLEQITRMPDTYFQRRVNSRRHVRWPSIHRCLRELERGNRRVLASSSWLRKTITFFVKEIEEHIFFVGGDRIYPDIENYLEQPSIMELDQRYFAFQAEYKRTGNPFLPPADLKRRSRSILAQSPQ